MSSSKYFQASSNQELVQYLKNCGIIRSSLVFNIMSLVDRRNFTSNFSKAYIDAPHIVTEDRTITSPHMHAMILELLIDKFRYSRRVLDIGSGSGYLTTCIALALRENGIVVGIECMPKLQQMATQIISNKYPELLINERVKFFVGDGRLGYPTMGPYDIIHVGAAVSKVPQILIEQLAPSGRLLVPIGTNDNNQVFTQIDKSRDGKITKKPLINVSYGFLIDTNVENHQKQDENSLYTNNDLKDISKCNITNINDIYHWLYDVEKKIDNYWLNQNKYMQKIKENIKKNNTTIETNDTGLRKGDSISYKNSVVSAQDFRNISTNLTNLSQYKTLTDTLLKTSLNVSFLSQSELKTNAHNDIPLLETSILSDTSYMKIVDESIKLKNISLQESIIDNVETQAQSEKLSFSTNFKMQNKRYDESIADNIMEVKELKNKTRSQLNDEFDLKKNVKLWESNIMLHDKHSKDCNQRFKVQRLSSKNESLKSTPKKIEHDSNETRNKVKNKMCSNKESIDVIENRIISKLSEMQANNEKSHKKQAEDYRKIEARILALEEKFKLIQDMRKYEIDESDYSKLIKSINFHSTALPHVNI